MSSELNYEIERRLKDLIDGEVRFRKIDRILYSTDASNFQIVPIGVVIPRNREDVVKTVETAREFGVSVLPRGGGTGLAGQSLGYGIILDFSKYLNKVIEVDRENKKAKVEPGIYLEQLNKHLKPDNLCFGPDPSTARVATVGGVIANNGTGAHSILYGMSGDHVLSSEVILNDGSPCRLSPDPDESSARVRKLGDQLAELRKKNLDLIKEKFPKHFRKASGYSLNYFLDEKFNPAKLIASSEGTLGISTDFELNLVENPRSKGLLILQFNNLLRAIETVPTILKSSPSAVELIDGMLIDLTRENRGYSHLLSFVKGNPEALLLVEFFGNDPDDVRKKLRDMDKYVEQKGWQCERDIAMDPEDQNKVWSLRKAGLGILMSNKSDFKPVPCIEDVSVPVDNLPKYVEDIQNILKKFGLKGGFYGHASAGCLHIRPLLNLKTKEGISRMKELESAALELALKYGGVMSGEHGDGIQRSYLNERLFGKELYDVMKDLKYIFDPDNIFNPGKVVESKSPEDDFRYSENLQPLTINTYLDWSRENGLLAASEMCNGQGVCRKLDEGIMCPSYIATRDEKDTTRARANTLRAILSGRVSKNALNSDQVYEVFDLCIACKGCGNECPSSVDVAKMKTEYLAQYKYENGFSVRDRIFANIHDISKYASYVPGLFNYMSELAPVKAIMSYTGVTPDRTLPQYSSERFTDWHKNRKTRGNSKGSGERVVYFHDTWTQYYFPEIGKSAVNILESLGYDVEVIYKRECCGRPMLSKGMVLKAKELARKILGDYVNDGIPVIGTEASCVSAFRDDYRSLVPSKKTEKLAENSFMLDEFLFNVHDNDKIELKPPAGKVLLHGHCHQRSLAGIDKTVDFLRSCGFNIFESNASCCGMAGSFGYEKEHYEISRKIGESRLFPAVRELDDGDIVCIAGISCLEQIEQFTDKKPVHLACLIDKCLDT